MKLFLRCKNIAENTVAFIIVEFCIYFTRGNYFKHGWSFIYAFVSYLFDVRFRSISNEIVDGKVRYPCGHNAMRYV